ncbi:MAG: LWR-salt protein [Halanaeroarchaeum sp.]
MRARYAFAVRFRLEPRQGVSTEPSTFQTRMYRPADEPGEPGWRFFRDTLWRGDAADDEHVRRLTEAALDVPIVSVEYRAFETDETYLERLRRPIAADLPEFKADDVDSVLTKYFGSTIEIRPDWTADEA